MKIGPTVAVDWKLILAGGAVAAGLYWLLTRDAVAAGKAVAGAVTDTAKAVGTAINPLNNDNAAASTVNAVGRALGDNAHERENWTLGGQFYDWFHGTKTTEGNYDYNNPYLD